MVRTFVEVTDGGIGLVVVDGPQNERGAALRWLAGKLAALDRLDDDLRSAEPKRTPEVAVAK